MDVDYAATPHLVPVPKETSSEDEREQVELPPLGTVIVPEGAVAGAETAPMAVDEAADRDEPMAAAPVE